MNRSSMVFRLTQRFLLSGTSNIIYDRERLVPRKFSTTNTENTNRRVGDSSQSQEAPTLENNTRNIERALSYQESERRARRRAFLEWQAGQREKGAAHRLVRLAKVTENNKRHHYHRQRGKLITISTKTTNTNCT